MRLFIEKNMKKFTQFIDWFYFPFIKKIIPVETFRYAFTGGTNTVLDIFLFFLTYNFVLQKSIVDLGFIAISPHIAAFLLVFPITFSTGFLLMKFVTFTSSELKGKVQLFRYIVSVSGAIVINYILLKLFVDVMGMYATMAKIITTVVVVTYSYFFQRLYTFKTSSLGQRSNS